MKIKSTRCLTAILFCAIMLLTVSCGSKQEGPSSIIDVYRNTALAFMESGDFESAIHALEEGVAATGDESLAALLEEAKAAQEAKNEDSTNENGSQLPETDHEDATGGGFDSEPTEPSRPTEPTEPTEPEDTEDPTEPTEPTELAESTEPTEPVSPPEDPSQAVGKFDNFVGTWQDEYGNGIYLCVGYGDATKEHAYAAFYSAYEFEVELEPGDLDGEGVLAFGASFPEVGSEPEHIIELYRYKWWLEAYISNSDGSEETIKFYPADMSLSPPENPYYVG